MVLQLPNGWLEEYPCITASTAKLGEQARPPYPFLNEVCFLKGELICVICATRFNVHVMLKNRYATPVKDSCVVCCPDCNAPIVHLGTDNGRAMLTRVRKRKRKAKK